MKLEAEFQQYLEEICGALGHADRRAGLKGYCQGLMLPLERKSIEPLAAHVDPSHVSARHQALHHFVAKSEWSDDAVMARVQKWVLAKMPRSQSVYWIIDDTGFPKKGKHSVGVARQYCGQLGKQDNCQIAVSLSIATEQASLPVAYQLYLPKDWAGDATRRKRAGVPDDVEFATKPTIALMQVKRAFESGLSKGIVLTDAGYGDETAFREGLSELGLKYAVGVRPGTSVWAPGTAPLPSRPWSGQGRPPKLLRRGPGHEPVSIKALATALPATSYRDVSWREGSNTALSGRFAAVRVRAAHRDNNAETVREEEWLLIEWPKGDAEPSKYWLSTLPVEMGLDELVYHTKMRWRIERDYQELKQEFGLSDFEGRGWRGFHHHATLCIAAYGFLVGERLAHGEQIKKNSIVGEISALPGNYIPRGTATGTTTRP